MHDLPAFDLPARPARAQQTRNIMTNIQAIIFDLDGVLVQSEPIHARAWADVLADQGFEFNIRDFKAWVGIPDEEFAPHLVEKGNLKITPEKLLEIKREQYRQAVARDLSKDPDLIKAVTGLKNRKMKVALATSSSGPEARHTLECAGLADLMDAIVSASDVENFKPHPEPYLRAAAALGQAPDACVALEDSPAGTTSARRAGCMVLGIASTHSPDQLPQAHRVFANTMDAMAWVGR